VNTLEKKPAKSKQNSQEEIIAAFERAIDKARLGKIEAQISQDKKRAFYYQAQINKAAKSIAAIRQISLFSNSAGALQPK